MKKTILIGAAGLVTGVIGYIYGRSRSTITTNDSAGMNKSEQYPLRPGVPEDDPTTSLGCDQTFNINHNKHINVLITGAGSYIGTSFESYCKEHYPNISITTLDMQKSDWKSDEVWKSGIDCVFHVAGIAHADVSKPDADTIETYYRVNTDLAIETAEKAKDAGVHQFIFMSSMIVYDTSTDGRVSRTTIPHPSNFYGDSKWQGDKGIRALASSFSTSASASASEDDSGKKDGKEKNKGVFETAILRPPMIYGRGSKGNYPTLSRLARRLPFFPAVRNHRSMLYIENLCEFVSLLALSGSGGIFFPQNREYSNTSELVTMIASAAGKKVTLSKLLTAAVWLCQRIPGKVRNLSNKAFGSSWYEMGISEYSGLDYQVVGLEESIRRTEE